MKVSGLFTYPVKSCGRLVHESVLLDERGPLWDRRFMVTKPDGTFLTQREYPRLSRVDTSLAGDQLRLALPEAGELSLPLHREAGEVRRVQVWDDVCEAWDEGEPAAAFFSGYLGTPTRLVRMADAFVRRVKEGYAPRPAQTGFADGFPLLVISEASLEELNRRLRERGRSAVTMDRFRPNVVVSGCVPFAEDGWRTIRVGRLTLDLVKPCARCVTTTVDQARGEAPDREEPLATLASFRRDGNHVLFGQNAVHREPGRMSVGETAFVLA